MKIGDYVRTKNGYISKYIGKNKTPYTIGEHLSFETTIRDVRYEETDNDTMIWKSELEKGLEEIIKSSPNIIDLVEVGDIVNYEQLNGGVVLNKKDDSIDTWSLLPNSLKNEDIKSIITKEQLKNNMYIVGE